MRRPDLAAAGLLLALTCSTAAACSSAAPAPGSVSGSVSGGSTTSAPGAPASESARASPSATTVPAPSGTAPDPDAPLTLAFAGDVHFARQLAALLDDPAQGLAELRPYLGAADLAMVNLETAITGRGVEAPKTYHFRSPPTALEAVAGAGVDVVTMANNHAVDYGADGLTDTLAARAASPVPVVGVGRDEADAYAPALVQVRGRRIALLGATQVVDWTARTFPARPGRPGVAVAIDPTRLVPAVREARAAADVVVVYLHWGTDYTSCPNPLQRSTARALADAGADVVVGAHAHQVQGGGWLGPTYVAYGLGNFVWYGRNSPEQAATGVLTLTLAGRRVVGQQWQPMEVSADGVPRVPATARAGQLAAAREGVRGCAGLAALAP